MAINLQSLELWRHALTASVRADSPDLSARQMALLLNVYLTEGPHTVRGLAADLKVSKPAISRALDRLGELGYVRRKRDELDRRNVLVQRTVAGSVFLVEFANLVNAAQAHLATLPDLPVMIAPDVEEGEEDAATGRPAAGTPQQPGWVDAAE
ncbi:MAG: MarR family transcriptional regulator [Alphaproteobacteria bacterium]|nr:MarR family transcriptional regulator [Alphaproteobacteria bacterium]